MFCEGGMWAVLCTGKEGGMAVCCIKNVGGVMHRYHGRCFVSEKWAVFDTGEAGVVLYRENKRCVLSLGCVGGLLYWDSRPRSVLGKFMAPVD